MVSAYPLIEWSIIVYMSFIFAYKFTNDEKDLIEIKLDKVTNNFNILLEDQVLFLTKLAEDN